MDDVQALRQQVKRLQRRLDAIEGVNANEKVVAEIVGGYDELGHAGGFARACAEAGAVAHRALRDKAVAELNSGRILTPFDEGSFREVYGQVRDIDVLLAEHRAGNRVR